MFYLTLQSRAQIGAQGLWGEARDIAIDVRPTREALPAATPKVDGEFRPISAFEKTTIIKLVLLLKTFYEMLLLVL